MDLTSEDRLPEPSAMDCMEIQGGTGSFENYFSRPGLDIWLCSQSQSTISAGGSDIYLLSSCASGRITRILLADVCSYGSGFVDTAGELRQMMKANINSIRQSRLVRQLSTHFENNAERGCFATMLLSTYFAPTRKLTLCNAGHAPPFVFRATTGTWSILKQKKYNQQSTKPLSGVVDPKLYQQFETKFEKGDLLLSYSSILPECLDEAGHTIGIEGLLKRACKICAEEPAKLATTLISSIRKEHYENLTIEDGTVILCRATPSKVPWKDNLLAPIRLLKNVKDKTQINKS